MHLKHSRKTVQLLLMLLFVLAATCAWYLSTTSHTPSPRNIGELRALESQFQKVKEKAVPAVVAVQCPDTSTIPGGPLYASGTIVSSDGLIVSSFHVSHRLPWDGVAPIEHLKAGEITTVVLADGKECQAELLGADQSSDISLLKLVEPGPYPYLSIAQDGSLNLGDWVLELGHPTGLQRHRPPVFRIGRVLASDEEFFVSDCNITGGDSGGPILNLEGEIVGIPSGIVANEKYFGESLFLWAKNKSGSPILYSAVPSNSILKTWELMLDGKILPFQGETSRMFHLINNVQRILPDSAWTRGGEVKKAFDFAKHDLSGCIVGILGSDGKQVSLGTVCTSDGRVLTLNSKLPDAPRCQLQNGKIVDCAIVRRYEKLDLAILKILSENAHGVQWSMTNDNPTVGTIVAAPLGDERSFSLGIISTPKLAPTNVVAQEYFEIDMCLESESCGGPVVNLDFEAVGITVRSHIYGTYVVPASQIHKLLDEPTD